MKSRLLANVSPMRYETIVSGKTPQNVTKKECRNIGTFKEIDNSFIIYVTLINNSDIFLSDDNENLGAQVRDCRQISLLILTLIWLGSLVVGFKVEGLGEGGGGGYM